MTTQEVERPVPNARIMMPDQTAWKHATIGVHGFQVRDADEQVSQNQQADANSEKSEGMQIDPEYGLQFWRRSPSHQMLLWI